MERTAGGRLLTAAAIAGKEDHLLGLKENVIMGHLIPAGTGKPEYRAIRGIDVVPEEAPEDVLEEAPSDLAETLDQGMIDPGEIQGMVEMEIAGE